MDFLKFAVFLSVLATVDCQGIAYDTACVQTDTCTVANTACNDLDLDHGTKCLCTAAYKENAGSDGCDAATALDATCAADGDCVSGASCVDLDGANAGTAKKCACTNGYHASGTNCVGNPGTACTQYGLSCTSNAACGSVNGIGTLPMTCQCSTGYYSDGINCVAGASFVTASTLIILVAVVASRLFF